MRQFSLVLLIIAALLSGCSQEESYQTPQTMTTAVVENQRQVPKVTVPEQYLTDTAWLEIADALEDPLVRLAYGDKSGLWENEYEYLHEQETFDDYIKHGEISWANVDSLLRLEITDIIFFDDSLALEVNFVFLDANGNDKSSPAQLFLYRHHDRWIKPYMTSLWRQQEYEKLVRQADDDSEDW